jgi:hypothetical protein
MMLFNVQIMADRFPTEYNVEASDVTTAAARALRQWKKRFRGSRAQEWNLRIVKANIPKHAEQSEIRAAG